MSTQVDEITVGTFSNDMDAQIAKAHLEAMGIGCLIRKDDVGGVLPNFQATSGVNLVVRKRDEKRARKLLKAIKAF